MIAAAAAGVALYVPASSALPVSLPPPRGTIAFAVAGAGDFGLATVPAAGGARRRLNVPAPTVLQRPAFSHDGGRIAYVCGNFQLCVVATSAGRVRARLTQAKQWVYDGAPAWRPDGRMLAFSSNRAGRYRIYVVGADGRGLRAVTRGGGADENPAWSPDGRRIAYDSKVGGAFRLFVVDVRSGSRRRVGPARGSATSPAWSPDGRWLAYTHTVTGGSRIELARVDRRATRILTRGRSRDDHAAWSPDGRWLVFDTNRGGGLHVWRVRASGGRPVAVTSGGSRDLFPVWRPMDRAAGAPPWPKAAAPTAPTGDARIVAAFVRRLLAIGVDFSRIQSNAVAAAAGIRRDAAAAKAELDPLPASTPRGKRFKAAALRAIATAASAGQELSLGIQAYTQQDRATGTRHFQRAFRLSRDFTTQVEQAQRLAGLLI